MILFDTSVLSRVFRRQRSGPSEARVQATVESLMASDLELGLPGIVLQEVLSGIRSERQFTDLRQQLESAFVIVLPTTDDHVSAARLRNRCLAKGVTVSGIDCLIAAVTMSGDHELFAMDEDFDAIARIAPLKIYA